MRARCVVVPLLLVTACGSERQRGVGCTEHHNVTGRLRHANYAQAVVFNVATGAGGEKVHRLFLCLCVDRRSLQFALQLRLQLPRIEVVANQHQLGGARVIRAPSAVKIAVKTTAYALHDQAHGGTW